MKQSIQHKASPGTTLLSLRQSLTSASNLPTRLQAARAILQAYHRLYSPAAVQRNLHELEQQATGIRFSVLAGRQQRQKLQLFCAFTQLVLEAMVVLHYGKEADTQSELREA